MPRCRNLTENITRTHYYGESSLTKLRTCHKRLYSCAELALRYSPFDITVVWGFRDEEQQTTAFRTGHSKTPWPDSKHNVHELLAEGHGVNRSSEVIPKSQAVDLAPWIDGRIPWDDDRAFCVLAGLMFYANNTMNADSDDESIGLRWGGDWDRDGLTTDQTFMDLGHFELVLP